MVISAGPTVANGGARLDVLFGKHIKLKLLVVPLRPKTQIPGTLKPVAKPLAIQCTIYIFDIGFIFISTLYYCNLQKLIDY